MLRFWGNSFQKQKETFESHCGEAGVPLFAATMQDVKKTAWQSTTFALQCTRRKNKK